MKENNVAHWDRVCCLSKVLILGLPRSLLRGKTGVRPTPRGHRETSSSTSLPVTEELRAQRSSPCRTCHWRSNLCHFQNFTKHREDHTDHLASCHSRRDWSKWSPSGTSCDDGNVLYLCCPMWQPPATCGYEAPEVLMACLRDSSQISIKSDLNGHMRLAAAGLDLLCRSAGKATRADSFVWALQTDLRFFPWLCT